MPKGATHRMKHPFTLRVAAPAVEDFEELLLLNVGYSTSRHITCAEGSLKLHILQRHNSCCDIAGHVRLLFEDTPSLRCAAQIMPALV